MGVGVWASVNVHTLEAAHKKNQLGYVKINNLKP